MLAKQNFFSNLNFPEIVHKEAAPELAENTKMFTFICLRNCFLVGHENEAKTQYL